MTSQRFQSCNSNILALWALEWAWHPAPINMLYARSWRIYVANPFLALD